MTDTPIRHAGGCLCGQLRYRVTARPLWTTICHCHFCQRATGAQGMVEPIFNKTDFTRTQGTETVYVHISEGSGQQVHVHFCATCGTKTHLTFARWPDVLGVYAGTFDQPGWFPIGPETAKFIFIDEAARGTLVPPGYPTYGQHSATADGTPLAPVELTEVLHIR